jgi:hypothetical protein
VILDGLRDDDDVGRVDAMAAVRLPGRVAATAPAEDIRAHSLAAVFSLARGSASANRDARSVITPVDINA